MLREVFLVTYFTEANTGQVERKNTRQVELAPEEILVEVVFFSRSENMPYINV